ncbi:MAG: hypothetical protein QNJ65_21935 [Xenococcaceae cyanobacterium MO_234.B1]|nr:hypothetical protein [Xenococcaceae cyanobacterium MO_234.B1]
MKIEIQGRDAVLATKELLAIEGLEGSYQILEEVERGEVNTTLVTIATIVAITSGTLTIAEKLYQWNQKYQKSLQNPVGARIEKVLIVAPNGNRLLLKDATVKQIHEVLGD